MRKLHTYTILSVLLNVLLIGISLAPDVYGADVIAPSKDNIFILTVKNIISIDMEGEAIEEFGSELTYGRRRSL